MDLRDFIASARLAASGARDPHQCAVLAARNSAQARRCSQAWTAFAASVTSGPEAERVQGRPAPSETLEPLP